MHVSISIGPEPLDATAEWTAFQQALDGATGAVAAFCGLVRDRFDDRPVGSLTLEHYPGMTEKSIERIVGTASKRWALQHVRVVHRVGTVGASEPIVLVLVASGHRDAAFAACELIMDLLKTEAVFWKKEDSPSGARWIESTEHDRKRARAWRENRPQD